MNLRPSGYEPDELPGCSTPRQSTVILRPGNDLLSRALRQSTIGAEDFYFRVRNGIGYGIFAITTRLSKYHLFSLLNHHMKKTYYCTRYFKPIELLVPVSYTYYYASTSGLSTW